MSTENQIKKAIYEIYQWYLAQTEIIRVALLIIVIVLAGFSLIHILKAFVYVAVNFPVALKNTSSGLRKFLRFITWPLRLIFRIIKWIIGIPGRIKNYFKVTRSKFNVYPERFKIPLWRRLLSRKIRREARTRFKCNEEAMKSLDKIKDSFNTYNISIEAKVGGGKTLLTTLLSQYKTLAFIDEIDEKISNTKKILYQLDFNKIDNMISTKYNESTYIPEIYDHILDDEEIADKLVGYYNNYRQETPKVTLMEDYIIAYCAKLRNNYVLANYTIYNKITNTFNFDLDESLLLIKNKEAMKKYYIPSYSVILEDELSLTSSKNDNDYHEISKKGKDTALKLIRHLKKETVCYIGNAQDTSRVANILRELSNMYIIIENMHVSGVQKSYSRVFQKKENKLIKKLDKKKKKWNVEKIDSYKKRIYDLYQKQNMIYAAGYLKFRLKIAYTLKDLDRWNRDDLKTVELCFPLTWGFGCYKKCQYSDVDKHLNSISLRSDENLKTIDDFFEEMDISHIKNILKSEEEINLEKEKKKMALKEAAKQAIKSNQKKEGDQK